MDVGGEREREGRIYVYKMIIFFSLLDFEVSELESEKTRTIFCFFFVCLFLAMPAACRSSQARDQTLYRSIDPSCCSDNTGSLTC